MMAPPAAAGAARRVSAIGDAAHPDAAERGPITADERSLALARAHRAALRYRIGWVVIDRARTSPELEAFAHSAFQLRHIETADGYDLYEVPFLF